MIVAVLVALVALCAIAAARLRAVGGRRGRECVFTDPLAVPIGKQVLHGPRPGTDT